MKNAIQWTLVCLVAVLFRDVSVAAPPNVGAGVDVAPKVEKSFAQKWPRAAWAAESKCWLVVWRGNGLVDEDADIWCARVSADGQALDPAGVPVCKAKNIQAYPVVASNGKDFLVSWMDFRTGKDWDVYAARVSSTGQVLDADGIALATAAHNQCRPDVAFVPGSAAYLVAWQNFVPEVLGGGAGSYNMWGARVGQDGKVLDAGGVKLVEHTAVRPSLAVDGSGAVALAFAGQGGKQTLRDNFSQGAYAFPAVVNVDLAKGAPAAVAAPTFIGVSTDPAKEGLSRLASWISYARVKDGSGIVATRGHRGGCTLLKVDKDGHYAGTFPETTRLHNYEWDETVVTPFSVASDGEVVLLTMDWPQPIKKGEPVRMGVYGWLVSNEGADGKIIEGSKVGFAIAAEAGRDHNLATASGGPAGRFLVVYSEPRAPEDVKVVARLVTREGKQPAQP